MTEKKKDIAKLKEEFKGFPISISDEGRRIWKLILKARQLGIKLGREEREKEIIKNLEQNIDKLDPKLAIKVAKSLLKK